jgi:hypothetical protein
MERTTCPIHHGPVSECGDDEADWFPQREICQPAMQLEAVKRLYSLRHQEKQYHDGSFPADLSKWAKEPSRDYPFHFADGVSFWMSREDRTPDEDWLGESVAQQAPGEQTEAADQTYGNE